MTNYQNQVYLLFMEGQQAKELLGRYKLGLCTEVEKATVEDWILYGVFPEYAISDAALSDQLSSLDQSLLLTHKSIKIWYQIAASAVVLLFSGVLVYLSQQEKSGNHEVFIGDGYAVVPGKNGATLTLGNGQKIILLIAVNGELSKETGVVISKTRDGMLVYKVNNHGGSAKNQTNTLSTARGDTYMVLSDQSKLWVNAVSSLKYFSSFASASKRHIELSGEA